MAGSVEAGSIIRSYERYLEQKDAGWSGNVGEDKIAVARFIYLAFFLNSRIDLFKLNKRLISAAVKAN